MNGIDVEDLIEALKDLSPGEACLIEDIIEQEDWDAVGELIRQALVAYGRIK